MSLKANPFLLPIIALMLFSFSAQSQVGLIDSLKSELPKAKNDTVTARIYHLLGQAYINSDLDSAIAYFDLGLPVAEKLKWEKGISVFMSDYSTVYSYKGDQAKAISYLEKSVKFNLKPGNERNLSSDYINLSTSYQQLAQYQKSADYLFKALDLSIKVKDNYLQGVCLGNISNLFFYQENYAKALQYALKHLQLSKSMGDDEQIGHANLKIGNIYLAREMNDSALVFLEAALGIAKKNTDRLQEARTLSSLAHAYEPTLLRKMEILLEAQKIYDAYFPDNVSAVSNIGNIGGTYAAMALKDSFNRFTVSEKKSYLTKAKLYLEKALAAAKEMEDPENISEYADNLAQVQEATGDYAGSLANFKIAKQIDDSLYSQETKNALANKESAYLEQLLLNKTELQKLELQKYWLIAAIVFSLIIIVSVFIINKFRFQKQAIENKLKQKEAEQITKELLHKNHITESELKAIRSQMNPHFIFNVLNSLESYILDNDKQTACRLVQKFAGLSRLILENSTQSFVEAAKEWKAIMLYTELQAIRYNSSFLYEFKVDYRLDLRSIYLPPMLIQPLVENAILHGLAEQSNGSKPMIKMQMEQSGDSVKIIVSDNGNGLNEKPRMNIVHSLKEQSLGLKFIKERIDMLNENFNKPRASFKLTNNEETKGATAELILPIWTGMEIREAI